MATERPPPRQRRPATPPSRRTDRTRPTGLSPPITRSRPCPVRPDDADQARPEPRTRGHGPSEAEKAELPDGRRCGLDAGAEHPGRRRDALRGVSEHPSGRRPLPHPARGASGSRCTTPTHPRPCRRWSSRRSTINRLVRMIKQGETPARSPGRSSRSSFTTATRWVTTRWPRLPGTDLKDEVVMLGGHLDSWHSGTGRHR